jgi:hypothetical protein
MPSYCAMPERVSNERPLHEFGCTALPARTDCDPSAGQESRA